MVTRAKSLLLQLKPVSLKLHTVFITDRIGLGRSDYGSDYINKYIILLSRSTYEVAILLLAITTTTDRLQVKYYK